MTYSEKKDRTQQFVCVFYLLISTEALGINFNKFLFSLRPFSVHCRKVHKKFIQQKPTINSNLTRNDHDDLVY